MAQSVLPRLRWGVAGYGDVVVRRGLPALTALGQDIRCVWGRDASRAAAVADRYGVPHGTSAVADLLHGVDAVYIATPVALHVPLATAAIAAGMHVLVEKPLGGGLDCDRAGLVAAQRAAGLVGAVAYYRRLAPALQAVAGLLSDGPYHGYVTFRAPFSPTPDDPMHWRTDVAAGGGVLADAGCHRIDLLCWLLGRPDQVSGQVTDPFPLGAERTANVSLHWPDGSTARLAARWASGPGQDEFTLIGRRHAIRLPQLDSGELLLDNGVRMRRLLPPEPNPLAPAIRDFLRAVGGDGAPNCSLTDGVLVDEVIRVAQGRSADLT